MKRVLARPDVLGVAEVTRWEAARRGDGPLLQRIAIARRLKKRVEGHMAGTSPRRLPALAACGLSSDHEAIAGAEALERLRQGLWVSFGTAGCAPICPIPCESYRPPPAARVGS